MLRGEPVFLHDPLEKLQRCGFVSLRRSQTFQDFAFMIDCAPKVAEPAVDLHKHLIEMPTPLWIAAPARDPLLSDLGGEYRTKSVPPKPDSLVADVDPPLANRSSTLRSDSGYRTYIITTRRMTSGELLK